MEYIGIGILIAIGMYFAPIILGLIVLIFTGIVMSITAVFTTKD